MPWSMLLLTDVLYDYIFLHTFISSTSILMACFPAIIELTVSYYLVTGGQEDRQACY